MKFWKAVWHSRMLWTLI